MFGGRNYPRAVGVLAAVAIFIATVGVHAVHPAMHSYALSADHHLASAGTYESCMPAPKAAGPAATAAAHPAARAHATACPVCEFLATFHSRSAAAGPLGFLAGLVERSFIPQEFDAVPALAWLPFGARGPPSQVLPVA